MDTNDKGQFALLKVKQLALERNILLSELTMPNCRYDLIVDCGERLVRAQVKYADAKCCQSSGCVYLNLRKITRGNKPGKQTSLTIRYEPAKNNQSKGCLMAQDYIW